VEPSERNARQLANRAEEEAALERQRRRRPVRCGRLEDEFGVEAARGEVPRCSVSRLDLAHEQELLALAPAEEGHSGRPPHLPARARSEAAAVGLDRGDARPPVGEVPRLG
jgi:hypothetical protein